MWFLFVYLFDAYIQLFFGFNLIGYEYNNGWKRLSGIFGDEYILGSYLSRIMPLILALFFHPLIKIDKKISKSIVLIILSSISTKVPVNGKLDQSALAVI